MPGWVVAKQTDVELRHIQISGRKLYLHLDELTGLQTVRHCQQGSPETRKGKRLTQQCINSWCHQGILLSILLTWQPIPNISTCYWQTRRASMRSGWLSITCKCYCRSNQPARGHCSICSWWSSTYFRSGGLAGNWWTWCWIHSAPVGSWPSLRSRSPGLHLDTFLCFTLVSGGVWQRRWTSCEYSVVIMHPAAQLSVCYLLELTVMHVAYFVSSVNIAPFPSVPRAWQCRRTTIFISSAQMLYAHDSTDNVITWRIVVLSGT